MDVDDDGHHQSLSIIIVHRHENYELQHFNHYDHVHDDSNDYGDGDDDNVTVSRMFWFLIGIRILP